MSSVTDVLDIIDIVAFLCTVPGNIFILVVTLKEWFKNKRLCVTHQLVLGIVFCNILNGFLENIFYIYELTTDDTINEDLYLFLVFLLMFCNLWFTTWLCVHFCLKTVDINQRVYIYLRRRFHKMLPWILFSSVIGSILFSIPLNWYKVNGSSQNLTLNGFSHNVSLNNVSENSCYYCKLAVNCIFILGAFILFFSAALTSILFLRRHMKRVRDYAEGSGLSSIEAHVRAARTLTSILILNILYFIAMVCYVVEGPSAITTYLFFILVSVCDVICAIILIKGIKTLNKALADSLTFCLCVETNSPSIS
ncbi:taste receptor type 2 member 40-like [Spea bombifrons]|uniref:taste receptor type 2 member 40-like n=1 Tax=Spea bombifrons TaxID=233779 RepID=UPI00234B44F4|nr:taste receptor type 2 member 40-like [Spea bombifrons]